MTDDVVGSRPGFLSATCRAATASRVGQVVFQTRCPSYRGSLSPPLPLTPSSFPPSSPFFHSFCLLSLFLSTFPCSCFVPISLRGESARHFDILFCFHLVIVVNENATYPMGNDRIHSLPMSLSRLFICHAVELSFFRFTQPGWERGRRMHT